MSRKVKPEHESPMPEFTIMVDRNGQKGWSGPNLPWSTQLVVVVKSDFDLLQTKLKQEQREADILRKELEQINGQ